MKDEVYFYQTYLKRFEDKKDKLHEKSGYEERAWKFEEMLSEQRVLDDICNFLWKKLGE